MLIGQANSFIFLIKKVREYRRFRNFEFLISIPSWDKENMGSILYGLLKNYFYAFFCHSRENGNPFFKISYWIPALRVVDLRGYDNFIRQNRLFQQPGKSNPAYLAYPFSFTYQFVNMQKTIY